MSMPKYNPTTVHANQKLSANEQRDERAKTRSEKAEKDSVSASTKTKLPSKVRFSTPKISLASGERFEAISDAISDIDEDVFQRVIGASAHKVSPFSTKDLEQYASNEGLDSFPIIEHRESSETSGNSKDSNSWGLVIRQLPTLCAKLLLTI